MLPSLTNKASPPRIDELDGLRGVFLLIMIANHLLAWPLVRLGIYGVTYQTLGYVTSAEGFFFISGLVCALAYGKVADRHGIAGLKAPLTRRIFKIYATNLAVAVVLVYSPLAAAGQPPWLAFLSREQQQLGALNFLELPLQVNLPWLSDILPLYLAFMPMIAVLLLLERRGRQGFGIALSIGLWLFAQTGPTARAAHQLEAWFPGHRFSLGWFEVAAWQLLFGAAFLLGRAAMRRTLPSWLSRPPPLLSLACLATAIVFAVQRHTGLPFPVAFVKQWTAAPALAPLRLLNFLCLAVLVRAHWSRLGPMLRWAPLRTIGKASLTVFFFHIVAVYALAAVVGPETPKEVLAGALVSVLLMTYIVALATRMRRRSTTAVPVLAPRSQPIPQATP